MVYKMKLEEINPFIRYAQFLTITSNRQYYNIASYDYRLFYCSGGSGQIIINDVSYSMNIGAIIFWPPGYQYSLQLNEEGTSFDLIGVNFDFTLNHSELSTPIPPAKWHNFKPETIVEQVYFTDIPELNRPIYLNDAPVLRSPMYNLTNDFIAKKLFHIPRISGLLKNVISLIVRAAIYNNSISKSEVLADKVIQYINSHYKDSITNQTLGEIFGYHPNHLNRIIVQNTGMSIHHYLINRRINAAIELLQASDIKTSEIAEAVGFKDVTHFLKYFKKATGKTTRDFRN